MDRDSALKSIKEGDRVIIRWARDARVGTVTHRTPGGRLTVESERATRRFNAKGRLVGASGWDSPHLEVWTEEAGRAIEESREREKLSSRLRDFAWKSLPLDVLRQVAAILAAQEGGEK